MDRDSERERSSRRSRDERERDSVKDHKHKHRQRRRSSDEDDDNDDRRRDELERRYVHDDEKNGNGERGRRARDRSPADADSKRVIPSGKSRDAKENTRVSSRPGSDDGHREASVGRHRVLDERDRGSLEKSMESRHSSTRKRKERDGGLIDDVDANARRVRVSEGEKEEKQERRRFEDKVYEEKKRDHGGKKDKKNNSNLSREREEDVEILVDTEGSKSRRKDRKFTDSRKSEDDKEINGLERKSVTLKDGQIDIGEPKVIVHQSNMVPVTGGQGNGETKAVSLDKNSSMDNVVSLEPFTVASAPPPLSTKVSLITTNDGNKEVNITRSDEVPGKFSTDVAATSSAGERRGLTLDALARAKKALQQRKELAEKLKKIPELNKLGTTAAKSSELTSSSEDGVKLPSSSEFGSDNSPMAVATSSGQVQLTSQVFPVGSVAPGLATIHNLQAVKRAQELAAKMGFHQDPDFAPLINMFPGTSTTATEPAVSMRSSKAPVLRLDALGREIDEHGNVINVPKLTNLSTLKVNINKRKKEAFQILKPELDADMQTSSHFDSSMGINKTKLLRPKRMTFQFVEEGKWSKQAENLKLKSQYGEARAKELRIKQSQLAKAKAEPDINPNFIQVSDRASKDRREQEEIVEIEWWDSGLLPSGNYADALDRINSEKITIYVEHPRPIEPPAEPAPPPPQPLKLTKKEQKKLRTQRRLAKERDRQEMIRQGLLEPPKPKVKMSNLMRVLGSEATQDPTKLEMEVRAAATEREQAHADRNIARKLTPAERREKKERKLFEDPTVLETLVSVYKINDLSHPQTRFKVDVNAQENRLTGCAVITDGGTSVVVVEGGKKPVKRYGKLMMKRIDWTAAVVGDDEDGGGAEDPRHKQANRCVLVWQGSVAKPSFHKFLVHQCRSDAAARKIFADARVPHYWDLAVNFSDEL